MAKPSADFHKGYLAALSHVHQLLGAHVEALQNGGQPTMLPMAPSPGGLPATAPAQVSTKPSPAFPYGRPSTVG